jgi:hypothetical protein
MASFTAELCRSSASRLRRWTQHKTNDLKSLDVALKAGLMQSNDGTGKIFFFNLLMLPISIDRLKPILKADRKSYNKTFTPSLLPFLLY